MLVSTRHMLTVLVSLAGAASARLAIPRRSDAGRWLGRVLLRWLRRVGAHPLAAALQ